MPNANDITLDDLLSRPLRETAPPQWYRSLEPACPHLLVLRLPPLLVAARAAKSNYLNRAFKVVVVESDTEFREAEQLLDRPLEVTPKGLSFLTSVDRIGVRRSLHRLETMMVLHYHTETQGWPFYVLTAMSDDMMGAVPGLQRGRYGYNAYATQREAIRTMKRFGRAVPSRQRLGFSDAELDAIAR